MSTVQPIVSPAAHRAAIDALDAQRAAYRRLAREAAAQQTALSSGDAEPAAAFADGLSKHVDALHERDRSARALVDATSRGMTDVQLLDIERRMAEMTREARNAETAIRNLTMHLETWRDAFGQQLAELGITPGEPQQPQRGGYGQSNPSSPPARILDRTG